MKKTDMIKIIREQSRSKSSSQSRLAVGDFVDLSEDGEHLVWFVNSSRASCIPVTRPKVEYETLAGKTVRFQPSGHPVNISPNSECPLLKRTGIEGALKFLGVGG